jgi:hypothetical protein
MKQLLWAAVLAAAAATASQASAQNAAPHLGARVRPEPGGGVRIVRVIPGELADDLGLQPGEVILTIGNPAEGVPDMLVDSGADVHAALAAIGDHVRLLVHNDACYFFVEADLEDTDVVDAAPAADLSPRRALASAAALWLVGLQAPPAPPKWVPPPTPPAPLTKVPPAAAPAEAKPPHVSEALPGLNKAVKRKPHVVAGSATRKDAPRPDWHRLPKKRT